MVRGDKQALFTSKSLIKRRDIWLLVAAAFIGVAANLASVHKLASSSRSGPCKAT